jgi:hypothetical protein
MHVKFHIKSIIFVLCVKRQKCILRNKTILVLKFCLFTHGTKHVDFFCEHVTCQGMHDTLFIYLFNIFKYV